MFSQQILVGSNYILASFQSFQDISSCRFNASHQLDHNTDLWVIQDFLPVIGQNLIRDSFSFFIQIFYQNFGDRKLCLYLAWHLTFPFFDQLVDTAAYCSGT